jgi:AraC-like DNA-binding protein
MLYHRRPAPPLSRHIEQIWFCENYQASHARERVLPTGGFGLILDLAAPGSLIAGMRSKYIVLETAALRSILGVMFRPGGARAFFDAPLDEFFNRDVALDCQWGRSAGALVSRLAETPSIDGKFDVVEAELIARMNGRAALHPAVTYAVADLFRNRHAGAIREISLDSGLSRRRLSQLFREQIGMTPKLYCRVHRFQQVLSQISSGSPVDWADVAIAGGFSDQSHLVHEFRDFSGMTPTEYTQADRPSRNHVPLE